MIGKICVWSLFVAMEEEYSEDEYGNPIDAEVEKSGEILDKTSKGYLVREKDPAKPDWNISVIPYHAIKRILERGEKLGEDLHIV